MAINFRGYLFDDAGSAIQGATVQLLQESDGAEEASTTTSAAGLWYFNEADQDKYDIKITRGSSIRYIQWNDQISLKEIDIRNDSAATTPALTATNLTNSTANQVAVFSGANATRADNDEIYLSFKLANSAGDIEEFARMTAVATDVTDGSEDAQIEFDVRKSGTLTKVWTITSSDGAMSFDMNIDSLTIGSGADTDIALTFDANSADGVITWMEDEDYFKFSDDILMNSTEKIQFYDTGLYIYSSTDGQLDIVADTEVQIAATTIDINGAVALNGAITGATDITLSGELDAATLDISGNSDFDGTLDVAGNTVISAGTFTVGSDGSGQDVIFYSGTSGDNLTWDSSEEVLQITGTNGATALDVLDGDVRVVDKLYLYDRGGEYLSSDGSTLTITGATTVSGGLTSTAASNTLGTTSFNDADITNVGGIALDTITSDGSNIGFGTDGSGEDVYFYSATSGDHMFWDASDEKLVITGTDGQNSLEVADGNVTITDNLTVSGNFTVSGTTTTVDTTNLTVTDPLIKLAQGTTASPANDLGIIFTRGNGSSTNIANRAILWDESADIFVFANTNDEAGTTTGNVDIDDYASIRVGAITADDNSTFTGTISAATGSTIGNITLANGSITDSSGALDFGNETLTTTGVVTAGGFTIGSAAILEAELEILDGATVTTTELNLIDGDTARGTTAVASGDGILINDGGTMRMTNVDTVSTYFASHTVGGGNIVTTGALDSGSITSGFGTIDTGSSTITTTGSLQIRTIDYSDGDLAMTIADGGGVTFAQDVAVADSKFIEFESAAGTPTTDNTVQGIVIEFLAVEAITQFDAVYVSTTTGRVGRADANDAAKMPVIGIAIEAQGSAGSSVRVLTHGVYRDDGGFGGNMTVGVDLYAPETPGTLTTTRPSDDGDFIQVIGVATGVRSAFINPSLDIIEHA